MSYSLVTRIWEYKFAPSERAILQAMADHADDAGGRVWPSMARVAWKTDYSERQVQRCVHALVQRGVLIIVHAASGRRPTEYRINLDAAERKPSFNTMGDTMSPRHNDTPDTMSPLQARRGDMVSPLMNGRGDIHDIVGVTSATPRDDTVSPEPTREQTIEKKIPLVPNGTSPTPKKYPDDFEEWWRACPPLMRRCGKGDGYEAWRKAKNRPSLAEMLRVLAFQVVSHAWMKEGGKYIPMATTYLNRSRWDAEEDAFPRDGPRASPNGNGHRPVTFAEQKDINTDAAIDEVRALIEGSNGNGSRAIPGRDEAGRRRLPG